MANHYFQFKQFIVFHDRCAMKVTTDACLFGAWCAEEVNKLSANKSIVNKSILDIGTGTGLLSLMVAQKNKLQIDAVEIDKEAANQAMQNIAKSPFADYIKVINTDIMDWKKDKYDIIISNPPFYENELQSLKLQKNIAHHSEALLLEDLFQLIKKKLTNSGCFYVLLPFKRKAAIEKLIHQNGLHSEKVVTVYPSEKHSPFRLLLKGSKQPTTLITDSISIYNLEKQYTPAFTALLREYYLYL